MNISLDNFIHNLKNIEKHGLVSLNEKQIKDLFFRVLEEITKRTIYDTTQARSVVIDEFAKRYGYDVSHLFPKPLNYWGNKRGRGEGYSTLSENKNNQLFEVDLTWSDIGLYAQENATTGYFNGRKYPSDYPPRDNSKFETVHITKVSDKWYTFESVQKEIRKIIKRMEELMFNVKNS